MASSKYIPPALRAKMAAEAEAAAAAARAEEEAALRAATGGAPTRTELNDWLREARKGYVPKTPEQIRAECLSMNYEQLRKRAGPPPAVTSDDFGGAWEQGGEGVGAAVCNSFDENLRFFKLGRGPPPEPLEFDGRDEGHCADLEAAVDGDYTSYVPSASSVRRSAYNTWYSTYGARLAWLWAAEHQATTRSAPPKRTERRQEQKPPSVSQLAALAAQIGDKSGW